MRVSSRRLAVVVFPVLLVLAIAVSTLLLDRGPGQYISVSELATDTRHVGEVVRFGGAVVSSQDRLLVLCPEHSDSPTLRVLLSDAEPEISLGQGVVVVGSGLLSKPGLIVDASVITPTGPSRFGNASPQ